MWYWCGVRPQRLQGGWASQKGWHRSEGPWQGGNIYIYKCFQSAKYFKMAICHWDTYTSIRQMLRCVYHYPEAILRPISNKHFIAYVWEWERLGAFGVKISNIQIDYLLNIAGTGRDLILPLTTNYNVVLDNYIRSHTSHICRAWCLCWRTGTARSSSWCSRATSPSSPSGSSPSTTSSQPWTKHVSTDHILWPCRGGTYFSGAYLSSYCFMSACLPLTWLHPIILSAPAQ